MGKLDITRHKLAQQFHYTGARMQQGRALLDSDWNEDALLEADDRRLTLADLIGAQGSSNAGFTVTNPSWEQASSSEPYLDFDLRAGSLFVGGLRVVIDPPGESYRDQTDWLRRELEGGQPVAPSLEELLPDLALSADLGLGDLPALQVAAPKYRYDLVYLEVWEQPVTAVEDAELRERALGGPDSSARIRRMRRVEVETDIGTDNPSDAFAALVAELENTQQGTLDPKTNELVSSARLTVTAIAPAGEQPCGPQPPSGYVGHEDEAIRVELRGAGSIVWGFGNAAPLYRVKVGAGGKTITFLDKPRDLRRRPRAGQIVEIVAWGARLPNGEKVAELTGNLYRVEKGYNPGAGELVLSEPIPQSWITWFDEHPQHWNPDDGEDGNYLYLRVWDRGNDTSSPPLIPAREGPVELGKTGIQIELEGGGRTGDYWLIAARRATPDVVVPWQLFNSAAPSGPRRFLSQLAVIRWEAPAGLWTAAQLSGVDQSKLYTVELIDNVHAVWGPLTAKVIDGRRRLQPLCIGGCCTITVGDGVTSNGVVNSLDEALAMLPSSGGRICLLPGDHAAEVELIERSQIEIYGSGPDCRLVNATDFAGGGEPTAKGPSLLVLKDCSGITLRNFAVAADAAIGVEIRGVNSQCEEILIEGVEFTQTGLFVSPLAPYELPQPAVLALGGDDITVRGCRVLVEDMLSYTGALVLGGERLRILDNWVQAGDFEAAAVARSMGGIHVLSRSQDVVVAGNVVHGGWGYGIALGHALEWLEAPASTSTITMDDIWAAAEDGLGLPVSYLFNHQPSIGAPIGTPADGNNWAPGGHLTKVRLDRNRISGMGLSGISTGMMRFMHIGVEEIVDAFIVVLDLEITRNLIVGNRRITNFTPANLFAPRADGACDLAVGGIVIAAGLDVTVAENRVVDNGADFTTPNCGLGFLAMQNLVVRDNYVVDNGLEEAGTIAEGLRGGIAIMEVTGSLGNSYYDTTHYEIVIPEQLSIANGSSKLALQVHRNEVAQRCGKALWVRRSFDDVVVTENSFLSLGDPAANTGLVDSVLTCVEVATSNFLTLPAAGACVDILGLSLAAGASGTHTITMVSPGTAATTGGSILFDGNSGKLDWSAPGGHAAAYVISSLDSVTMTGNTLTADMHGTYPGGYGLVFFQTIVDPGEPDYSCLITNCYVGAASTLIIKGNRMIEGETDAILSLTVGPALSPADVSMTELRDALVVSGLVVSRCGVIEQPTSELVTAEKNLSIRKLADGCPFSLKHNAGAPKQIEIQF